MFYICYNDFLHMLPFVTRRIKSQDEADSSFLKDPEITSKEALIWPIIMTFPKFFTQHVVKKKKLRLCLGVCCVTLHRTCQGTFLLQD